ncbi:MAG TPA: hypothetical protein VM819_16205 [Vicinamibacterales bacterium]|jgi:hypothetical protein|nr:hypothetical protein [Vicinamibacterales bacterium]
MAARSIHSTLTRHFLRRFLENDLISPEADRAQLLAVVGASLFSVTLMVSLFMSFVYLGPGWTPSGLAIAALNDRHFYIALSMTVAALLAVAQWDSLVVDIRDASILEPLPVRPTTIRRAKLAAVGILGIAAALLVNLMPTLIFPWLLVFTTRVSVFDMATLIAAHAVVTVAAAMWAYLTVIALREVVAALLTPRLLAYASPIVQGALIVILGSALLLIPPSSHRIERRDFTKARSLSPPMWFLGVYESLVGDVLRDAPARRTLTPRQARADRAASALYARHQNDFTTLARRAGIVSGLTVVLAACAYWWNSRRFPAAAPLRSGRRRRWHRAWLARLAVLRDQTSRAGFFFTLAAVWRSNLHRLTIACAGAAGVAAAVVTLSGLDVEELATVAHMPTAVFAIQPMFYGALLVAFRHGIRVPAELRANWSFQLAWRNRTRDFLNGVRRAALAGIVVPALLIVLPMFWFFLGLELALAHALLGFAGAVVLLEILMFTYAKVPFTCTYVPSDNLKALAVPYLVLFLSGASSFAGMQKGALQSPGAAVRLLLLLGAILIALRLASRSRATLPQIEFDEAPTATQRLGLHV